LKSRFALPLFVAMLLLAFSASASDLLLGTAVVSGAGFLNNRPVSGYALSLGNGDVLRTGAHSTAIITVSDTDTLLVAENSGVVLKKQADGIAAELEQGRVVVATNQKRLREMLLNNQGVYVQGSPGAFSRYEVARLSTDTYVMPNKGSVVIHESNGIPTEVREGMVGVVGPGSLQELAQARQQTPPPAAPAPPGARAGQVSAAIPADYIIRGPAQMNGVTGADVLLNDLLKTANKGRVRVLLDDGSILTVGQNSQLQVREHNVQSQQTSMEMLYGKMRAQVVKMTAPNAKWEVRTSTAICGVLGTDFYIEATPTRTRVVVFDGVVRMTPLAAAAAAVTVSAGQQAVSTSSSATPPTAASASQIQVAQAATTIGAAQTAAAAGAATIAGSHVALIAAIAAPPAIAAAVAVPLLTRNNGPTSPSSPK